MKDGAVLGDVDVFTGVHRITTLGDVRLFGKLEEGVPDLVGEKILRHIDVQVGNVEGVALSTLGVNVKQAAQLVRPVNEVGFQIGELSPCGGGRSVDGSLHNSSLGDAAAIVSSTPTALIMFGIDYMEDT